MNYLIEEWNEMRIQKAPDRSQIMLAYTRDEVQQLNEKAPRHPTFPRRIGKGQSP